MTFPWFEKSVEELPGMGLIPRQGTKTLYSCMAQQKKKKKVRILTCKIKPLSNIESWESTVATVSGIIKSEAENTP